MNIFQKISMLTKVKWKPLRRHKKLFVFRRAYCYIHPTAKIQIKNSLLMNKSYGRQINAKKGLFKLGKNASFQCDNVLAYEGSTIAAHDNAKLYIGSGYIK